MSAAPRFDAHLHLQDSRLQPHLDAIVVELRRLGITRWVVNGTGESDWPEVARLAERYPEVLPCYGLHPWFVTDRSDHWEETLAEFLSNLDARAIAVGEIGLDKWIRHHDIDDQEHVFRRQLRLAQDAGLPAVIHCLKAWGRLRDVLQSDWNSENEAFLLHSFGGPAEMIPDFAELGGYFSFSGYFLHERKANVLDSFRRIPRDRILIETDAPDMALPESREIHPLTAIDGERLNHPANLIAVYQGLAEVLEISVETLAAEVAANFERFYHPPPL